MENSVNLVKTQSVTDLNLCNCLLLTCKNGISSSLDPQEDCLLTDLLLICLLVV